MRKLLNAINYVSHAEGALGRVSKHTPKPMQRLQVLRAGSHLKQRTRTAGRARWIPLRLAHPGFTLFNSPSIVGIQTFCVADKTPAASRRCRISSAWARLASFASSTVTTL